MSHALEGERRSGNEAQTIHSGKGHRAAAPGGGGAGAGQAGRGGVPGALSISEQSYYRWRSEYGGLKLEQARRMKDLEKENGRLKKAVAELTLDKQILKEALAGNF